MNKILIMLFLSILSFTAAGDVYVHGYTRSNGTYVAPYYRSDPNNTTNDNWSTKGNMNPYTGQSGTKNPTFDQPGYGQNSYQQTTQFVTQSTYTTPNNTTTSPSQYKYDNTTGTEYYESHLPNGDIQISYHNKVTNSYWQTVYMPDGNQYGLDEDGNFWEFQKSTGVYMNYGTGITCVGYGNSKTCVYPNYFTNRNVTCVETGNSSTCVYPN
jgi:hypothetical protein